MANNRANWRKDFQIRTGSMPSNDLINVDAKAFTKGTTAAAKEIDRILQNSWDLRKPFKILQMYMQKKVETNFAQQKYGKRKWQDLGEFYFYLRYARAARNPGKANYPTVKRINAEEGKRLMPWTLQKKYPNLRQGRHINIMEDTGELRRSFKPGGHLNISEIRRMYFEYGTGKQLWFKTRDDFGNRLKVKNIPGRPRKVIGIAKADRLFFLDLLKQHIGGGGR